MKFKVTMKDPDTLYDAIETGIEDNLESAKDCLDSSWWQTKGSPEELEDHYHDEIIFGDQAAVVKKILQCRGE